MQIYINNKLMNVVSRGAERNGYQKVVVAEPGGPASAEHQIPYNFINDEQSGAVYTGGNWYSFKPRDEGVHLGEAPAIAPVPAPAKLERMIVPVISTHHISYPVAQTLNTNKYRNSPYLVCAAYEEGFFIRVLDGQEESPDLPQCLRDVAAWAKKNRFDWVRLDRDAEQVDGLTSYNW